MPTMTALSVLVTCLLAVPAEAQYCSASGGCDGVVLKRVEVGAADMGWTGCDGYADFTSLSSTMQAGRGYPMKISYSSYLVPQCGLWVDWNQDDDFDDSSEQVPVVRDTEYQSDFYYATIAPPADAALGNRRMRLRLIRGVTLSPCGDQYNGEVEDYTIRVVDKDPTIVIISSYPYEESFESGFGNWDVSADDDFDWVRFSGYSSDVRPPAGAGDYYMVVDATGHSSQTAIWEGPYFDLDTLSQPILRFKHYYGGEDDSGSLSVEVSDDQGQSWVTVWTSPSSGSYGWYSANVELPGYSEPVRIRFRAVIGNSDLAIDKISVAECLPPAAPSGLKDIVTDDFYIWWYWQDNANDEDGFRAYDESGNLVWSTGRNQIDEVESGLTANTRYTRRLHAYNYCGESGPSNECSVWTLPVSPSVSCDRQTGEPGYPIGTVFTFTNNAGFGSGGVDHYHYVWDENPSYGFTGSEPSWSEGTLQLTADAAGQWYLHVLSHNGADDDNGSLNRGPYYVGMTDPKTSEIHGIKFNDLNANGTLNPGEPGLQGWKIYIDANENGQWDQGEPYNVTDSNGSYAITGLPSGTYRAAEVNQPDWEQTLPPGEGVHTVSLGFDQVVENINFGNFLPPGQIRGAKWHDLDADGAWDPNEPGSPDWKIYIDVNENGQWDDAEPYGLTNSNGSYAITDVPLGTYVVAEVNEPGWEQTFPAGPGTHSVTVGAGAVVENVDFGNYLPPARIYGLSWHDLDGDGLCDAGEPALAGWKIYLDLNHDGRFNRGEPNVTTDQHGNYEFVDLPAGIYSVAQVCPRRWFQTTPMAKPSSGNLLVGVDEVITEYTPTGQVVRKIPVPYAGTNPVMYQVRDLTVNQENAIYVYNGTFGPVLSKYSQDTQQWQHYEIPGLSTIAGLSLGAIASFQNYIFLTDHDTSGAPEKGIVRFNTLDLSYQRFAAEKLSFLDLNIGLDGLLYALENGGFVYVYDPLTLELINSFHVTVVSSNGSLAANASGEVFVAGWGGGVYKYDSSGTRLASGSTGVNNQADIDIAADGIIVVSSIYDFDIVLTDESLAGFTSFSVGNWQDNDTAFASFVSLTTSHKVEIGFGEAARADFGNRSQTLAGDLDYDKDVDTADLATFVEQWLFEELPADIAPGAGDGIVNFVDWALFAGQWQTTLDIDGLADFAEQWLRTGANYHAADIAPVDAPDGLVNMLDFAALAENWLATSE